MADTKISALADAGALNGAELVPLVKSGSNVKSNVTAIATWLASAFGFTKANAAGGAPGATNDGGQGYAAGSTWLDTATGTRWSCRSAASGAAEWMPLSAMDHPGYVSGRTYSAQRGTYVAAAMTANLLYAVPVYVAQRVTIASLGLRVSTGASGSVLIGLYANAGGVPGGKIAEIASAASTGTAATLQAALASNLTLNPGLYWLAAIFSAAPTAAAIAATDQLVVSLVGADMAADAYSSSSITGVTGSGSYAGGLPASFGTATPRNGTSPLLGFTVA